MNEDGKEYDEKEYIDIQQKFRLAPLEKIRKIALNLGVDSKNKFGETLLMQAAAVGREDIVDMLISLECDVNVVNEDGLSALFYAARDGNSIIIKKLIDSSISKDYYGRTPLMFARSVEAFRTLIKKFDINEKDGEGNTLLHYWVNEDREIFRFLLNNGAEPNITDNDGNTPLMFVDNYEQAVQLIEKGANLNIKNKSGDTPFLNFSKYEKGLCWRLLNDGYFMEANFDEKDTEGHTVLMNAIENPFLVESLLEMRILDINKQDMFGNTALIYSVIKGDTKSYQLLLSYGAREDIINNEGKMAIDYQTTIEDQEYQSRQTTSDE